VKPFAVIPWLCAEDPLRIPGRLLDEIEHSLKIFDAVDSVQLLRKSVKQYAAAPTNNRSMNPELSWRDSWMTP
jgi:hypothetical protein